MKNYKIKGYIPAREGGKAMVGSLGPYYVEPTKGNLIQVIEPTPSKLSKKVKYSKISYTRSDGSKKTIANHLIVAETFLGTKGEYLANGAPPPPFLIEKHGEEKAVKLWEAADSRVKEAFGLEAVEVDHKNNVGDDYSVENLQYMYSTQNREKG